MGIPNPLGIYREMISSINPAAPANFSKRPERIAGGFVYCIMASLPMFLYFLYLLILIAHQTDSLLAGNLGVMIFFFPLLFIGIMYNLYGMVGLIVSAALVMLSSIILAFVTSVLTFVSARLLGGKGLFRTHLFYSCLLFGGFLTLSALVSFLPCIGPLLQLLVFVFYFNSTYKMVKNLHGLSQGRSLVVALLQILFYGVVIVSAFYIVYLLSRGLWLPYY